MENNSGRISYFEQQKLASSELTEAARTITQEVYDSVNLAIEASKRFHETLTGEEKTNEIRALLKFLPKKSLPKEIFLALKIMNSPVETVRMAEKLNDSNYNFQAAYDSLPEWRIKLINLRNALGVLINLNPNA